MTHKPIAWRAGMTLVELLVVFGIVALLGSLLFPALNRARSNARRSISLSNIRTIGISVQKYADEQRDFPPVFFDPIPGHYPETPQQIVAVGARTVRGYWFDEATEYHAGLSPALPVGVLQSPGHDPDWLEMDGDVPTTSFADYWLTDTLYADPAYWNRYTQQGPSQWRAQHFSHIRYPSDKGLLYQVWVYSEPGLAARQQVPHYAGVSGAVAWSDLSAQQIVQSDLIQGEPNFYDPWRRTPPTFLDNGWAIRSTLHGVYGRDR